MELRNIFLTISCTALLAACSDDFLENKPQGSLSDGVMTSSDAIDLLVNSAYEGLAGFTNEQGDPWVRLFEFFVPINHCCCASLLRLS